MVDGNKLGTVGFEKLGTPYSKMDCQAFIEWCLRQCGCNKDLSGSNAWYREVMKNGAIMTPEECVKQLGKVPVGAFLFIHAFDGGEEKRGYHDGLGNASHIGIVTGKGEGAIHSSSSRGCVAESKFKGKTINGGWNKVGLWNQVCFDYGYSAPSTTVGETKSLILKRGVKGTQVAYIQATLMALGYNLGSYGADGDFGKITEEAVKDFQRDHGLVPDGVVGPDTWKMLEEPIATPHLYTVTIPNLTEIQADEIISKYGGSKKVE